MNERTSDGRWSEYRQLRALGLSLAQIAARFGVSRTAVAKACGADPAEALAELTRADGTKRPCEYCGDDGECVDVVKHGTRLAAPEPHTMRVVACFDCRRMLGGCRDRDLADRKATVKAKIRRLYARELDMPKWSERELKALSLELQGYVTKGINAQAKLRDRLAW